MTTKIYITPDGSEFTSKERAMEYQDLQKIEDSEFVTQRMEFLRLRDISEQALSELYTFQDTCEHERVKIKANSDTGNYDRSQDSYWFEVECKCCEKRWHEDQGDRKYRPNDKNVEWIK